MCLEVQCNRHIAKIKSLTFSREKASTVVFYSNVESPTLLSEDSSDKNESFLLLRFLCLRTTWLISSNIASMMVYSKIFSNLFITEYSS